MTAVWIILSVAILTVFYIISVFNALQTIRTRIQASIQEIGNQLKRQADLIPNLVESTKGYMKHEERIFDKLTEARKSITSALKSGSAKKMVEAQEMLNKAVKSFQVVVESTPQIKASEVVSRLMAELRDTADKVMYSRRTLIDLVADFNQKLVTFPSNLVANVFGFKPEEGLKMPETKAHLEVKEEELETPKVEL